MDAIYILEIYVELVFSVSDGCGGLVKPKLFYRDTSFICQKLLVYHMDG